MTVARVYLRVSREDEAGILANQRAKALEHVEFQHYNLAGIYEEVASGADDQRVKFNRLMADVRTGDVVIFTALSRVTRNGTLAALEILRQLETRGVRWHFIEQPFLNVDETTPEMVRNILLTILAELDKEYRLRISRATKAALARKKSAGGRVGRKPGAKDNRPRKKRPPKSALVALRDEQPPR